MTDETPPLPLTTPNRTIAQPMALSAFSPQLFFAAATGEPLDPAKTITSTETVVPSSGVHVVKASSDGATSLLWLRAAVAPIRLRDAFIRDIEEGKIPFPITTPLTDLPITRARYLSLEALQSRGPSIASVLGLTECLADEAAQSRVRVCPACDSPASIFHSASELCDEIVREWRGRTIQIELKGPTEALLAWVESQGFAPPTTSQGISSVRLDTFTCDERRCQQIQSLLASTMRMSSAWFLVSDASERAEYAWNGRCSACQTQGAPFQRSLAIDAIERGDPERAKDETSRLINGLPLARLLRRSLGEIMGDSSTTNLLPEPQGLAISELRLKDLSLGELTSALPPHILAKLPLVSFLRHSREAGELLLIDPPSELLSKEDENALTSIAERVANAAVVWLKTPSSATREIPQFSGAKSPELGTLSRSDNSGVSYVVRRGEWTTVRPEGGASEKRLFASVEHALRGESSSFSFQSAATFTPHFIPFLSIDTSMSRLVAHEFGAVDPLAKLFAASHHAKTLGLTHRDFIIGQLRPSASVCGTCKGVGLERVGDRGEFLSVKPCGSCWGTHFRSPAREVSFKGKMMWELLNTPLESIASTLRALPKMREVVEVATLFGLTTVPLGMPVALLPRATRRLVSIASALLSGTTSRPALIALEEPFVGLTSEQVSGLTLAVTHPQWSAKAAWIAVQNRS